jgi:hypothetical protein
MNENMAAFAWSTIAKAITPTSTAITGNPPPSRPATVSATPAQNTPERFEASVFISPVVFPPAAKKVPQATMPAHTGRAAGPRAT